MRNLRARIENEVLGGPFDWAGSLRLDLVLSTEEACRAELAALRAASEERAA